MAESPRPANRQFYSLPTSSTEDANEKISTSECHAREQSDKDSFLQYISDNVIGAEKTFSGPFGLRKVTYLDFVASGRALNFIEDYIRSEVLPEYGNTHTTTSVTSLQTTLFRHESRDILRNSFNASEHDSVIFTGSGSTAAVHKLIHALNLEENPSVVLVGPYEHHSNILPWKEAGAEVIRIHQTETGHIDMNHLEMTLKAYQGDHRQLIGAFSAASNVTGVLANVNAITICLHKHNALALWDYACAAPYVKLDVNPYIGGPDQQYVYKDAVFFSVHKFVGGISTPGVLIVKKKLFKHPVPEGCGGGSVFFVRRDNHRYLQEPESKEEGGTPAIVQSIRAGLVVQLREAVGVDTIHSRDQWLLSQAQAAWRDCPELIQLGPHPGPESPDKLPIFSFLVVHKQTGRFLHHNFVAAVLNDVFGIQARGGCACAGPYALDLLGLEEKMAKVIENLIVEDSRLDRTHLRRTREYSHREILRPGFVRLNLPYFMDEECLQFVLEAVRMTAEHAWKLLPQYLFNPETAEWRQRHFQTFKDRKWLGHISYQSGQMKYHEPKQNFKGPLPLSYQDCLAKAEKIFEDASKLRLKVPDQSALFDEDARKCRWFCLPSEANACLMQQQGLSARLLPIHISQDELPFFPGRLDIFQFKSDSRQMEFPHASLTTDKAQEELNMTISNEMTLEFAGKVNDNVSGSQNDVSEIELGAGTENVSNKRGGISALEDAIKHANSILKACGSNDTTKAVDDMMNNIWQDFDPNNPQYILMKESKTSGSPLQEVSSTVNHIQDTFSVQESKNCLSAENGREKNLGGLTDIKSDNFVAIQNAMNEIWEYFTPRRPKKAKIDQSTDNNTENKIVAQVADTVNEISENFASTQYAIRKSGNNVNETLQDSKTDVILKNDKVDEALNAVSETRDHFKHDNATAAPQGSQLSSTETDDEPKIDKVAEVVNALKEMREYFTPETENADTEADRPSSNSVLEINPKTDLVAEVVNAMKEIREYFTPETENADTEADRPSSNSVLEINPKTDQVAEVVNAMKEIREYFTPETENADTEADRPSSDSVLEINPKTDQVAEVANAMKKIREHFTLETENTNTEGVKSLSNSILEKDPNTDQVAEVVNAMKEIREYFTPETENADTEADRPSSNSVLEINPKTDQVAEVVNAMKEIREYFTPKHANVDTESYKPSSNSVLEINSKTDKVSEVVNSMKEIREHFTPETENVNSEDAKPLSNIILEKDPKTDKVSEVVNAMKEIREHFTLTTQNTNTEGVKPLSNSVLEKDSKTDNVTEVVDAMNKIWEHFTPNNEKVNIDGDSKTNFSSQEACHFKETKTPSKQLIASQSLSFSKGMIQVLNQGFGDPVIDDETKEETATFSKSCPSNEDLTSSFQSTFTHRKTEVTAAPTNTGVDIGSSTKVTPLTSHQDSTSFVEEKDTFACPLVKYRGPTIKESGYRNFSKLPSTGAQWFSPPKQIFKAAVAALEEYSMLKNGDKVLVCLSGGKDSLSLLHTVRQYQFYAKGKGILFEFGAVTVDPMTPSYDPSPLKQYLASLGVPYYYESQCILKTAEQLPYECASICSFCSRMKRGRIYAAARREGYNVLALGQHLDDLTESFLMSFFHNGNLNTMKAHYTVKQGDLRVIRPFVYVREADLRAFAEQHKLPVIAENCPACFEAPKERHRTKQLLAAQEVMFPQVYSSMMAALKPLMARGINVKSSTSGEED